MGKLICLGLILGGCAQVDPNKGRADAPRLSCATGLTDCGGACVDLQNDPNHCGSCGRACALCSRGECVQKCPIGTIKCNASCIDPQNDATFCGAIAPCETAAQQGDTCASDERCVGGSCTCSGGLTRCGNACVDTQNDDSHCGVCDKACTGCSGGQCPGAPEWEEMFVAGQSSTSQCTSYTNFLSSLTSGYQSVTIFGSNDPTGITCAQPNIVDQIAAGLKAGTQFHLTCDGHVWSHCDWYGGELHIDAAFQCTGANCPNPGYLFRICHTGAWGGVGTDTCSSAPSQTMGLRFQ